MEKEFKTGLEIEKSDNNFFGIGSFLNVKKVTSDEDGELIYFVYNKKGVFLGTIEFDILWGRFVWIQSLDVFMDSSCLKSLVSFMEGLKSG